MRHSLGLDEVTQSVYRSVLSNPGRDIGHIASELGASETVVRESVNHLIRLSLLCHVSGALRPANPVDGLNSFLRQQEADLLHRQHEFLEARAEVNRLLAEYSDMCCPSPRNEWKQFTDEEAVHARTEVLARDAQVECLSLSPGGPQRPDGSAAVRSPHREMLQGDMSTRVIYRDSLYNDRPGLKYARWLADSGGEVRTAPAVPLWLVIFDREVALLPIDPERGDLGALQVTGEGILAALVAMFEQVWASATRLGAAQRTTDDVPTKLEHEVLRLLCQGLTDEAVSTKVGISLRSVRRMVSDLMARLGSRSRFQLGANAVDVGWLTACRCKSDGLS